MRDETRRYDAVYVFETDFQKSIVETLVHLRPESEKRLLIDARNRRIVINGEEFCIYLNGIKLVLLSFRERRRLPCIYTEELICTAITGFNCRLFPAIIRHAHLSLIDDGTGTPVILKEGKYVRRSFHNVVRFVFASLYSLFVYGKFLPGDRSLLCSVYKYYSIYPFIDEGYKDKYAPQAEIVLLDYFHPLQFKIVDGLGYVSTGEWRLKNKALARVSAKERRRLLYYPHPHEDLESLKNDSVEQIIRPDCTLESYFAENGVPSRLYGEISTVFINLKLMGCPADMTVLYSFDRKMEGYYSLFESVGVHLTEL